MNIAQLKTLVFSIITNSGQLSVEVCLFLCLKNCCKTTNLLLLLCLSEVGFKILCRIKFSFTPTLHESFVRIFHVAGKFLQNFVCCMNLLSETSMQDAWIFHVFQKVCLCAWMQRASFCCHVN